MLAKLTPSYRQRVGLWVLSFGFFAYSFSLHQPELTPVEGYGHEYTMNYVEVLQNHWEAARYVEQHYSSKRILANWPLIEYLRNPEMGYVSKKLMIVDSQLEPFDVVVSALNGNPTDKKFLEQLETKMRLKKIITFGNENIWTNIYERQFGF